MIITLSLLIGVIAGLRALTAPATLSWAAYLGWLLLGGSPLAFLSHVAAPYVLTVLAIGELITDQLPKTPSKRPEVRFESKTRSAPYDVAEDTGFRPTSSAIS